LTAALLIVVASCSTGPDDAGTTDDAAAHEDLPQVDAQYGGDAALSFPQSDPPGELRVEVLAEGDGPVVEDGAAVLADYAGHVWGSGEPFDSSFDRGAPALFPLNGVIEGWSQGIPGHEAGSRLLISIPPELGYGPSGGTPDGRIGPDDTIVFVVDVIEAVNPTDAGAADATVVADEDELPVSLDAGPGEPVMPHVRDGAEVPEEPTVEIIAEGDGPQAESGDDVVVAYSIITWTNSEQESTWPQFEGSQPVPEVARLGAGQWYDLLADVPTGSRVLLTLPGGESGEGVAIVADLLLTHSN